MRRLVGRSLRALVGALVVYSCAGKSISRSDDDEPTPTVGDDFGDGSPGTSGGRGGTTSVGGKGGTVGKGGAPGKGGTAGRGGTTSAGGAIGKGGTGGTTSIGGTNVAGDDGGGFGGSDCGLSRTSSVAQGTCSVQNRLSCLSPLAPSGDNVSRNEVVADPGGGEGGESGDSGDDMASALMCFLPQSASAYLAVDYYAFENEIPGFAFLSGSVACQGYEIGSLTFNDYARPPVDLWTTQCFAVTESDLDDSVSVVTYSPSNRVRNLRFVPSCDCPRQITRYTTCGDITSPRYCL